MIENVDQSFIITSDTIFWRSKYYGKCLLNWATCNIFPSCNTNRAVAIDEEMQLFGAPIWGQKTKKVFAKRKNSAHNKHW